MLAAALVLAAVQTPIHSWNGFVPGDHFGHDVADVGDLDGDGRSEIAVGAPDYGLFKGLVFVYSGRTGRALYRWAGAATGETVDGAGDVNADGVPDVVYGGRWNGFGPGRVVVRSGADGSVLHKIVGAYYTNVGIGSAVSGAGDLDGDGRDDFLASDFFYSGMTWAYSGADGSELFSFYADPEPLGLDGGRDVTGDGVPDILVGYEGRVEVFSGVDGSAALVVNAPTGAEQFGESVAYAGDLNGDGREDFLAGAPGSFGSKGRAYVFSGLDGALLFTLDDGGQGPSEFGTSVAGGKDTNGDGTPDLLVGAPYKNEPGKDAGRGYLFSGADGTLLQEFRGPAERTLMGQSAALVGDVDQGGLADAVLGGTHPNTFFGGLGYAAVFRGEPPPAPYCTGKTNSQGCTPSIAGSGAPSATGGALTITATDVINQRNGYLFWSLAPNAKPFAGGTYCVQAPVVREPVFSGGNPPPDDCSGVLSFVWATPYTNAAGLGVGQSVYAQYWYTDPADPTGVGLSDALHFVVLP